MTRGPVGAQGLPPASQPDRLAFRLEGSLSDLPRTRSAELAASRNRREFLAAAAKLSFAASVSAAASAVFANDDREAILVVDQLGGVAGLGALFKVDPESGRRAVPSDFGDPTQGPLGRW